MQSDTIIEFISPRNLSAATRECLYWQPNENKESESAAFRADVRQRRKKPLVNMPAPPARPQPYPTDPDLDPNFVVPHRPTSRRKAFTRNAVVASRESGDKSGGTTTAVVSIPVAASDHYDVIAGAASELHPPSADNGPQRRSRQGVKPLHAIRREVGDEGFLQSDRQLDGDDSADATARRPHTAKKRIDGLWEWQRRKFGVDHQVASDLRSKVQIVEDAKREHSRKVHREFVNHLKTAAMYRSVNRIPVRTGLTQREMRAIAVAEERAKFQKERAKSARRRQMAEEEEEEVDPNHKLPNVPTASLQHHDSNHSHCAEETTPRGGSSRPLSRRVRAKIKEMVEKFGVEVPSHHHQQQRSPRDATQTLPPPAPPRQVRICE